MNGPLYRSQTRSLLVVDLPTALRNAMLMHADHKKLKLVRCPTWLTHRENPASKTLFGKLFGKRSNRVDPDAAHDLALVLHATHLLVGTSGPLRGTAVLSLPLLVATATRGSRPSDDGLTIHGFPGDGGNAGTYFVGLGPGADAEACVEAVFAALEAAKNPPSPPPS